MNTHNATNPRVVDPAIVPSNPSGPNKRLIVGLALLAAPVVALVYLPEYAASARPLQILALALAPLFLNNVLLNALNACGRGALLPVVGPPFVVAELLTPAGPSSRSRAPAAARGRTQGRPRGARAVHRGGGLIAEQAELSARGGRRCSGGAGGVEVEAALAGGGAPRRGL